MLDLDDRLAELKELGLYRRTRMVSGPQGPRVVLDGQPVLLLCSGNALGLADHPRVRQAAADAAMRWGVGAAAPRLSCGTMTLHRRLEERLASFMRSDAAVLFGAGTLANLGVIPALARRGEAVLYDELSHSSIVDGCKLAGAEAVPYAHGDPEHLAWALRQADGRAVLIATDGVFGTDGDIAPLEEIVLLAGRNNARVLVDESHALGAIGPGGRGAVADAGVRDEVDVITGSLGKALGSFGGYACCDHVTSRYLTNTARPLLDSTSPAPVAVAAALASLELLAEQPRLVEKLQANAEVLRDELAREGFEVSGACTQVVPLHVGRSDLALRIVDCALDDGVLAEAVVPPLVREGGARVRVTAMASHTRTELREAAHVLGRAALRCGFRPGAGIPMAAAPGVEPTARGVFDGEDEAALPRAA
jgi:glycine C-acetyltransferase/8-amino-7-oxononanoate synthase